MRRRGQRPWRRKSAALDAFAIHGIRHNIPFLSALMGHERWKAGRLSTGFIAEEFGADFTNPAPAGAVALRLACVAAVVDAKLNARKRLISGQMPVARPVIFERRRTVRVGERDLVFALDGADGHWVMDIEGAAPVTVTSDVAAGRARVARHGGWRSDRRRG